MRVKRNIRGPIFLFLLLLLAIASSALKANAGLFVEALPRNELLHDGCLHIFMLGTGDPETEMQNIRKPSCIAVIADDRVFFFDAGEGAVQTAARLGLPYARLSKVFITHWHSDHFGGLGALLNASWVHGRQQLVDIYGPYGTSEVVGGLNKAYRLDTVFRASTVHGLLNPNLAAGHPHDMDAEVKGTRVYSDDQMEISCFPVEHTPVVPAFGYVINYGGAKVVISGDTAVVNSLEEQSKNADVLISESFSRPLSAKVATSAKAAQVVKELASYHCDSLDLAKMAERAGVKRLILTHLVPSIATTDEAKQAFTEGMTDLYKGALTVADDGDQIILRPKSNAQTEIEYIHQKQPQIPVFPRPSTEAPTG